MFDEQGDHKTICPTETVSSPAGSGRGGRRKRESISSRMTGKAGSRKCDPPVSVEVLPRDREVIEVRVTEGSDKPYRCRDGFFMRTGPSTQKLTRNEITDLILSQGKHRYDEIVNEAFVFQRDFDPDRFAPDPIVDRLSKGEVSSWREQE